ncbi:amiloride-sensitive sodium channel subunit beta-like [Ptychodera flava]|uniref:amiloride-sensitive sodium channel subunit beta-like n=1 Tax=Ptychodera flava TaxID=63121 RepID=UPI00396AAC1D
MDQWVGNNQTDSFKNVLNDLLANSSSDGLTNIQRSKHPAAKLFWTLLFLAGVGVLSWQISVLVTSFLKRDVDVTLKMQFNNTIDFPVVTICNTNALKLSALLRDFDMAEELMSPDSPYLARMYAYRKGKKERPGKDSRSEEEDGGRGGGRGGREGDKDEEESQSSSFFSPSTNTTGTVSQDGSDGPNEGSFTDLFSMSASHPAHQTKSLGPNGSLLLTSSSEPTSISKEPPLSSTTGEVNVSSYLTSDMFNNVTNVTNANSTTYFDWLDHMDDEQFYETMDNSHVLKLLLRQHLAKKNESERVGMGYDIRRMLVDCIWKGYPCSPRNFTRIPNAIYGNCYMFNTVKNDVALKTNRPGMAYGLTLELFVDQDDYIPDITETAGIRVAIDPQDMVPFPEDNGISVSPGFSTEIGLRLIQIERQPDPYGDCIDINNIPNKYYKNNIYMTKFKVGYSVQSCEKSCYQDTLIEHCSCYDTDYPPTEEAMEQGIKPCNILANYTERHCYEQINVLFDLDKLECDCPQPCQEKSYLKSMSFSKWPAVNYQDQLKIKVARRLPKSSQSDDIMSWTRDNVLRIQIYFEELNYQSIKENPAYTGFELCSDIGGQLGLWIGVSMITLFEIFEFFASIVPLLSRRFLGAATMPKSKSGTPVQKITPSDRQ